jgi:hypothetical protein
MFNLDEYTTVRERIIEFWKRNPNGRIETEILEWSDKRFIVAARLYRSMEDTKPFSTGLANEVITDRGVNKDFALENGATSAIGIACANANIGIDKHKASREEMTKVVAQKPAKPTVADVQDYWTTPVNEYMKVVDAPVTLDKALDLMQDILGTGESQEAPQCKHGHMRWREGEKNGRAWGGYQCNQMNAGGIKSDCPPIWYNIGSDGKWQPQKARV